MSRFSLQNPRKGFILFVFVGLICLANIEHPLKTGATSRNNPRSLKPNNRTSSADLFGINGGKSSCCGAKAETGNFTPVTSPEYEAYKLTATYYSLRDNLATTLMLNNKGPQPLPATPTFYSLAGTRLVLAPIIVPAASYIEVDMHTLLAGAADEFNEGSMKIAYEGGNLQLGAQVRMIDAERKLIWAEQFIYTSKFLSNRLESVWWLPFDDSKTRLVVSNTSSQTITATIKTDGTSPNQSIPYQVTLAPWETRVLGIMRDVVGNENGRLHEKGGVSITHSGTPGAILARMYIAKPNKGYSAAVPFIDPENTASQKWNGAGLRLKINGDNLEPVLVVRNTGDQPTTVNGRLPYTRPNGNVDEIVIPSRTIPANSTRIISLRNLIDNADVPSAVKFIGIEVNYTSPRGTLLTSVQSVSADGEHVFQVPMQDPQKLPSSSGGFPWKADGDFRTLVYIKNETTQTRIYTANMIYPGGGYSLGQNEIRPGETVAIDFRKLRDAQTPDSMGKIIPLNLEKGQIHWSGVGIENNILTGRSEQISASGGIASTYACYGCCSDSFYNAWIDAPFEIFSIGDTGGFSAVQQDMNCNGQVMTPYYVTSSLTWYSTTTSVASVSSVGEAEALSVGTTYIGARWNTTQWDGSFGYCVPTQVPVDSSGPLEVRPVVTNVTSDAATYKITNVVGNANLIHFVTPKGSGDVTLTATISPDNIGIRANITWEGATQSSTNPLVATLARGTASKNIVKIKHHGNTLKELRVWVVWSTITSANIPLGVIAGNTVTGIPPGSALALQGGYSFTHTISPASIITDDNRPDFAGTNATAPPGGNHPFNGGALSGGADKKWDNSRQIRIKVLNPNNISNNDLAQPVPTNFLNYPTNDVEGNDDTSTGASLTPPEETNNPYANNQTLTGRDVPRWAIAHRGGANGDTWEMRFQFQEFTRLEIEGTWYRISDFYPWRLHFKFLKANGLWTDNNSDKALDNAGF